MKTITIGGREWRPVVKSTISHDTHSRRAAAKLGIDKLPAKKEEAAEWAQSLFDRAIESGVAFELLGCLIVPAGIPDEAWTPKVAAETAKFLDGLTELADKAIVAGSFATLLARFFVDALPFWMRSADVSKDAEGQREEMAAASS